MKNITENKRWKKRIGGLLAIAMTSLMVSCPVLDGKGLYAYAQEIQVQDGTVVTTCDEFLSAIAQKKPVILVQGSVTVVNGALSSGKMKPVVIPEGTTIMSVTDAENSEDKGTLSFRCPVQIGGENVIFKNIEMFFISGDALGSVPHREIFLAGHALTLDNVTTQQDRDGGSLGDLGGSEDQLPVVYAGGFEGTQNGEHAALYIQNSNSKTVIQKIYMAHDAGTESMTGYNGEAYVQIDADVTVKDGIDATGSSQAEIVVSDEAVSGILPVARTTTFCGDVHTSLRFLQVQVDSAAIDGVGTVLMDEKSYVSMSEASADLQNVTVRNGAYLDYVNDKNPVIQGDFTGAKEEETAGYLALNKDGQLTIYGKVDGSTNLQTGSGTLPGTMNAGYSYILADQTGEDDFVLHPTHVNNGFGLTYENGAWKTYLNTVGYQISCIDIVSEPAVVDINLLQDGSMSQITEDSSYFGVLWYDENGTVYDEDDVYQGGFYDTYTVFGIKTEYWEDTSGKYLEKEDWGNAVYLEMSDEYPNRYYLCADEEVQTGEYTYLFCDRYFLDEMQTVQDVKGIEPYVKAWAKVRFYDSKVEEKPSETPASSASPSATPAPSASPSSQPSVTPEPSASASSKPSTGSSASSKPSASPSASSQPSASPSTSSQPSVAPSASPSSKPSVSPSAPPSSEPSAIPSASPSASSQPSTAPSASSKPSTGPSASSKPSVAPSASSQPSTTPSASASSQPSATPSSQPSVTPEPSASASSQPSASPSASSQPSTAPSAPPSSEPSVSPSVTPSETPTPSDTPSPSPSPEAEPGDVDGDGKVSLADAQKILKLALRIIEPEDEFVRKQADANGDGQITLADAQKVLRIALKIEN